MHLGCETILYPSLDRFVRVACRSFIRMYWHFIQLFILFLNHSNGWHVCHFNIFSDALVHTLTNFRYLVIACLFQKIMQVLLLFMQLWGCIELVLILWLAREMKCLIIRFSMVKFLSCIYSYGFTILIKPVFVNFHTFKVLYIAIY